MPVPARTIAAIEKANPDGLSSRQILDFFAKNGGRLSEATLRKYVQLGLLPRSRRVGQKGKHRGSRGIYPVEVIRRVFEIRKAMEEGATLESLASAGQAVRARLSLVRVAMDEASEAAQKELARCDLARADRSAVKKELTRLQKEGKAWVRDMERWTAAAARADRTGPGGGAADRSANGARAGAGGRRAKR